MNKKFTLGILNKAGKAGKSTFAKQFIAPILGADWIQIETFNEKGAGAALTMGGRKLGLIAEAMALQLTHKVFDIGSSNYEAALKEMEEIDGFAAEVDAWVIPVQPIIGHINETLSTIADLINRLGVEPSKIVVIPNSVERPEDGYDDFAAIAAAAKKFGFHFVEACIVQNPVFALLSGDHRSIIEIADEVIDYPALIAAETDVEKRANLAAAKTLQGRAKFLARNLRGVWASSPLAALTDEAVAA